ncbi:MAG: nickel pincer cofactor biosynthesis protein LarC [Desulfobacterales bacterium]|nr:nickel pincer cofactor biosynthesis protein LarC [Desulfobacterales bacterium]
MLAYFDCFSGISGDMALGAFMDLGVPADWLTNQLAGLPLTGFDLSVKTVFRGGIAAKRVEVLTSGDRESRNYAGIIRLIGDSALKETVKNTSIEIFDRIAAVESRIHGCPKEKVHLHETGGLDAVVDIVGTALCIAYLDIKRVVASRLPLGSGFVNCAHGTLPVPAPATLEILKGAPVYGTEIPAELITPTGAAIIMTLADSFDAMPLLIPEKIGYGAGGRDLKNRPNLLRVLMGREPKTATDDPDGLETDHVRVVETCIDDMNPELFGFLMERLFEDGALDVYWIPVYMKKNRPGTLVQVLCRPEHERAVVRRILSETTSLGVRFHEVRRCILARGMATVETSYGPIPMKWARQPDGNIRRMPEYEVCRKIALEKQVPLRAVYDKILNEAGADEKLIDKQRHDI